MSVIAKMDPVAPLPHLLYDPFAQGGTAPMLQGVTATAPPTTLPLSTPLGFTSPGSTTVSSSQQLVNGIGVARGAHPVGANATVAATADDPFMKALGMIGSHVVDPDIAAAEAAGAAAFDDFIKASGKASAVKATLTAKDAAAALGVLAVPPPAPTANVDVGTAAAALSMQVGIDIQAATQIVLSAANLGLPPSGVLGSIPAVGGAPGMPPFGSLSTMGPIGAAPGTKGPQAPSLTTSSPKGEVPQMQAFLPVGMKPPSLNKKPPARAPEPPVRDLPPTPGFPSNVTAESAMVSQVPGRQLASQSSVSLAEQLAAQSAGSVASTAKATLSPSTGSAAYDPFDPEERVAPEVGAASSLAAGIAAQAASAAQASWDSALHKTAGPSHDQLHEILRQAQGSEQNGEAVSKEPTNFGAINFGIKEQKPKTAVQSPVPAFRNKFVSGGPQGGSTKSQGIAPSFSSGSAAGVVPSLKSIFPDGELKSIFPEASMDIIDDGGLEKHIVDRPLPTVLPVPTESLIKKASKSRSRGKSKRKKSKDRKKKSRSRKRRRKYKSASSSSSSSRSRSRSRSRKRSRSRRRSPEKKRKAGGGWDALQPETSSVAATQSLMQSGFAMPPMPPGAVGGGSLVTGGLSGPVLMAPGMPKTNRPPQSSKMCVKFLSGTCTDLVCTLRHPASTQEMNDWLARFAGIPCSFGGQCRRQNCLYSHNYSGPPPGMPGGGGTPGLPMM